MQDLFTNTEVTTNLLTPSNSPKGENKKGDSKKTPPPTGTPLEKGRIKSLFKVYYKGKGGRFSDKESARIVQIENENRIFKNNWYYWKRQATRLSEDYRTEHEKVLEMKEKLKELEEKLSTYEKENIQQQEVPAA